MQTYDIKVKLSESVFNEVRVEGATAAEVTVLRRIHGPESIAEIKPGKHVKRTDDEERARLQGVYGKAVARNEKIRSLDAILGVPGVPLPQTIPGVDSLPPPTTGKRAKAETPAPAETSEPAATDPELNFS